MKEKFTLEYPIGSTVGSLYKMLTTQEGLSEWFADHVDINGDVYTMTWRKVNENVRRLAGKENQYVRFQWEDDADSHYYFQFRITSHELTGDVTLMIDDFATADEVEDQTNFWNSLIQNLRRALGSY